MSVPINKQDFKRFIKLADLFMRFKKGEMSIYTSDKGYASIEIRGTLPAKDIMDIFNEESENISEIIQPPYPIHTPVVADVVDDVMKEYEGQELDNDHE